MGRPLAIEQHKPKQKKMRFLVSFAFLLAVASVVLSARLKRDTCEDSKIETHDKCIKAFEGYEFIKHYNCTEECQNCGFCDGSGTYSKCEFCKKGFTDCDEDVPKLPIDGFCECVTACRKVKAECCACDEAKNPKDLC